MSTRPRRPTEEGVGVNDPKRRRALFGPQPAVPTAPPIAPPTANAPLATTAAESWEQDATEVAPRPGAAAIEQATPTHIQLSGPQAPIEQATPTDLYTTPAASPAASGPQRPPRPSIEQATPTELTARPERSEPIRVISMKERTGARPRTDPAGEPRVPLHVQLRSMAEVAGLHDPPSGLGNLAPPRDPRQARARRRRDNVLWAFVAIALASGISLSIWFLAGR